MIAFTHLGHLGRLGNQLFQIAATIAHALRHNDKYVFPPWEYEPYFNLHGCFSSSIRPTQIYREPFFPHAPIPPPNSPNETQDLVGYLQSWKYFDDCQDIIHGLLTPKIGYGIKYGYTGIHIRRGDYIGLTKEYVQLGMDYFQQAMNMIKSPYYIVFSDDIEWCKMYFRGENIEFSEGRSPADDLALYSSCENSIIANSSFSWWGAWLNKNPSKIVIAPQQWFGPGLPHDTKDLLPTNWTKIS
jgi:hypothetical protein